MASKMAKIIVNSDWKIQSKDEELKYYNYVTNKKETCIHTKYNVQ